MGILEVEGLSYSYTDHKKILKNISFSIEKGKYISILGHNGSGKSTLAKVLMGLLSNYKGRIVINSKELNDSNLGLIRKEIAMVFQNPDNQFIGTSVEDDIAFGLENNNVSHDEMPALIQYYAKKVGMEEFLKKEPINLSGGQKQRVAIAGVLALKPKIIIFDEATSMLDPKGKRGINQLIKEVRSQNPDLTVISITHDVEEAFESDEVIILNKGEIAVKGKPNEVMVDEKFMNDINLNVPFSVKVINALRERGFTINTDATLEEIGEMICQSK